MVPSNPYRKSDMLIWDTGASFRLKPVRSYFIHYVKADIPVKDITKVNRVIDIGTTIHIFIDVNGTTCYLPFVSYQHLSTYVQLFSPQTYHQMHGGYSTVYGHHVIVHLKDHNINSNIRTWTRQRLFLILKSIFKSNQLWKIKLNWTIY